MLRRMSSNRDRARACTECRAERDGCLNGCCSRMMEAQQEERQKGRRSVITASGFAVRSARAQPSALLELLVAVLVPGWSELKSGVVLSVKRGQQGRVHSVCALSHRTRRDLWLRISRIVRLFFFFSFSSTKLLHLISNRVGKNQSSRQVVLTTNTLESFHHRFDIPSFLPQGFESLNSPSAHHVVSSNTERRTCAGAEATTFRTRYVFPNPPSVSCLDHGSLCSKRC